MSILILSFVYSLLLPSWLVLLLLRGVLLFFPALPVALGLRSSLCSYLSALPTPSQCCCPATDLASRDVRRPQISAPPALPSPTGPRLSNSVLHVAIWPPNRLHQTGHHHLFLVSDVCHPQPHLPSDSQPEGSLWLHPPPQPPCLSLPITHCSSRFWPWHWPKLFV